LVHTLDTLQNISIKVRKVGQLISFSHSDCNQHTLLYNINMNSLIIILSLGLLSLANCQILGFGSCPDVTLQQDFDPVKVSERED